MSGVSGFPLSPQQARLWRLERAAGGVPFTARLLLAVDGELAPERLDAALARLVARHEILRTRFEAVPGVALPLQVIAEPERVAAEPVLAVATPTLADGRRGLRLTLPALCADAETLGLLTGELAGELTGGEAGGDEEPLQYADLASWQTELLESEETADGRDYWRRLELPPLPAAPRGGDGFVSAEIASPRGEELLAAAAETAVALGGEATPEDVVLAAWVALLARHHGDPRPLIGRRFDGRRYAELAGALGPLARYLPFVAAASVERSFAALVAEVAERRLAAAARQEFVDWPALPRAAAAAGEAEAPPFFPFCFSSLPASPPHRVETADGALVLTPLAAEALSDRFELELRVRRQGPHPHLALAWDPSRRRGEEARRLLDRLGILLAAAASRPDAGLGSLPLLTAADRRRLFVELNDVAAPRPERPAVHRLFAEQTVRTPDAEAVRDPAGAWSYGELAAATDVVAAALVRRGVGPETRVAVLAPRSRELMAALLGVLAAGGAYVPLEPSAPPSRLAWLAADAGASLLLTVAASADEAAAVGRELAGALPVLDVGELLAAPGGSGGGGTGPAAAAVGGDALAYVLYTSGSTGRPKGVMVSHRSVVDYLLAAAERYARPGQAVPVHSPVAFDLTVTSLFAPLAVGGRLLMLPEEPSVESLAELLGRDGELAFVKLTPAHLDAVARLLPAGPRASVGSLVLGGEALLGESLAAWHGDGEPVVVNEYGPTEATVGCSLHATPASRLAAGPVPIGGPMPNARLYVADRRLEALPEGVAGELLIGGPGVARGYLGRPALTAERFVPDPFSGEPGGRLYRSGDLARRRDDGGLDFLGRADRQLKLRGHRVEPGEIEATLRRAPGVADAAVDLRPDERGEPRLVAWVVAPQGGGDDFAAERRHAAVELPSYMRPAAYVGLRELPLTANGKVDRAALPEPDWRRGGGRRFEAPRAGVEARLAALWSEVLGVERVGRDDNFFQLGGDSILGIELVGRAAAGGLRLSARQIFRHQTLVELAADLETAAPSEVVGEGGEESDGTALTPAQAWFFASGPSDPNHFNQALEAALDEAVDEGDLRRALAAVAAAHGAFADRFERRDGRWERRRAPNAGAVPPLAAIDLSALPAGRHRAVRRAAAAAAQRSLDLARGPLLRALLFRAGEAPADEPARRLLLVAHHLVVDGVSWRLLGEELEAALAGGRPPRPAAEPLAAAGWAARLARWAESPEAARQARFWSERDWRRLSPLPGEGSGGEAAPGRVGDSESVCVDFDPRFTATLFDNAARVYGAGGDEVLLAALAGALTVPGETARTAVMVEGHGRVEPPGMAAGDPSRTVGWLTAIYPVLFDLTASAGVADRLLRVRQEMGSVPAGGLAFGALLHLAGDSAGPVAERLRTAAAAPRVLFNHHGRLDRGAAGRALRLLPAAAPGEDDMGPRQPAADRRPFPLEVTASVAADGGLRAIWTWDRRLGGAAVAAAARRFADELRRLAEWCGSAGGDTFGYVPADFPLAALGAGDLERLLAGAGAAGGRPVEDVHPLSPAQQGILFHHDADTESGLYFDQVSCRLEGPLDAAALRRAWETAQRRHAVLRTSYHRTAGGEPRAVVWKRAPLPWHQVDLTALPAARRPAAVARLLAADRRRLDPAVAPLLRFLLLREAADRHRFVWSSHHLLLDGWSSTSLLGEVFAAYRAEVGGEAAPAPPRLPFRDFVGWLGEQEPAAAREHWRRVLDGAEPSLLAGVGTPPGERPAEAAGERRAAWPPAVDERLRRVAAGAGLTPYTLVLGAWALVVGRHLGVGRRDVDVVFGSVAAGRPPELAGSESIVGMTINVLPVRARFAAHEAALDALRRLQDEQAAARVFEHAPLAEIQSWCGLDPRRPLFDSLVVFQNYSADLGWLSRAEGESGLRLADVEFAERTNYPLTLLASSGDGLGLRLAFDRGRVDEATAERLLGHLVTLLTGFAEAPSTPLAELPMLTAGERRELAAWNRTARSWDDPSALPRRIAEQARRTPDAVAVEATRGTADGADRQLSYAALDLLSGRLARRLAAAGVEPGSVVAVCLERSPEMIVALVAALRAGAAYLPLDPENPSERLAWMLADAAPAALLVAGAGEAATAGWAGRRLRVDLPALASTDAAAPPPVEPPAGAAAYLIYTSGSTGRPKGVLNSHGALHNRLWWQQSAFPIGAGDRVAQKTPFTFDVSVWELFWPLLVGARLSFAPPRTHRDPAALASWMADAGITVCHFVPSMLRAFVAEPRAAGVASLTRVVASGEALDPDLVRRFAAVLPGVALDNLYGPTEAAIDVTHHRCHPVADAAGVPIGRPISNLEIHLLDRRGRPVPVGVTAELSIGGAGLARGYRGRPALTAERFVPHPLAGEPGLRLYRSGDLARWRPDGAVEYLGRLDDQVKIRGFRVEPGEIEAELQRHPAVSGAAVTPRRFGGDLRLVAWLVAAAGEPAPEDAELRTFLARTLPAHMVPSHYARLDELPLNANGKVDRGALAARPLDAPPPAASGAPTAAPTGPLAEIVAGAWAEVLGSPRPPAAGDDFFALGGHSLLAARVAARLRDALGFEVPVSLLLEEPELGRFVERLRPLAGGAAAEPLTRRPEGEEATLSFAQRRLWLESRLAPDSAAYNTTAAPRLTGRLDVAAWEQAAAEVVRRHEVLRSRFPERDGRPAVEVDPPVPLHPPLVDLTRLPAERRQAVAERLVAGQAARPFDLARDRQFRHRLLRLGDASHAAPLTLHHAVIDGWSRGVLAGELTALYDAYRGGRPSPLAELPLQYADYAAWQRRRMGSGAFEEDLEHWRRRLTPLPPELRLWRRGGSSAAGSGAPGAQLDSELPAALSARLAEVARSQGVTLYMALLAAFAALLYRLTGEVDLAVGCAVAGRDRRETEGLIGCFVNLVVLRLDASGSPRLGELLHRVRRVALDAYAHQELPYDRLVERLRPELGERALVEVAYGLDETPGGAVADTGLAWREGDVEQVEARFPLTLWWRRRGDRLVASWAYRSDLFDGDEIAGMAAGLEAMLSALVERPDARLDGVELESEDERRRRQRLDDERNRSKERRLKSTRRRAVS